MILPVSHLEKDNHRIAIVFIIFSQWPVKANKH
jgi:hypothetical protein